MTEAFFSGRLPVPPSINVSHRPGGRNGRTVHTKVARVFLRDAMKMMETASIDRDVVRGIQEKKMRGIQTPIALSITYFFDSMWRRDEDGPVKITQDVIFAYLGLKDNLVIDLHVKKRMDKAHPHTEFSLSLAQE